MAAAFGPAAGPDALTFARRLSQILLALIAALPACRDEQFALPLGDDHRAFVRALLEYILQAGRDVEARDLEAELEGVGSEAVRKVRRITDSRDRKALDRALDLVLEADSVDQILSTLD